MPSTREGGRPRKVGVISLADHILKNLAELSKLIQVFRIPIVEHWPLPIAPTRAHLRAVLPPPTPHFLNSPFTPAA